MRNSLLFIFILFINESVMGQELIGRYEDGIDHIEFSHNRVFYSVGSDGGLIIMLNGYGVFRVVDKYLIIYHENYPWDKSKVTVDCNGKSGLTILSSSFILNPFINVSCFDKKGQFVGGTMFELNSNSTSAIPESTSTIRLSAFGADSIHINILDGCEYFIEIASGEVIEEGSSVFKINSVSKCSLELILLSTSFKSKSISVNSLRRFERKAHRRPYPIGRTRYFVKKDCYLE